MTKKKSFREEVAEQFLKALEEKPLEWYKSWQCTDTGRAINITTNKPYKGVNSFWLKHKEYNHGYGDNRWATFKQIKDKGWKLAKGSKGEKVEFYMPIDNYIEKAISWDKYNNLSEEEKGEVITKANGKKVERYSLGTKIYTVFNASQIEGVPKLNLKLVKNNIKADEVVQRIAEGMKVEIREIENSSKPSYSPSGDYITMPKASQFNSDYYYAATALHELGHSTGHESRLNRDLTGGFGSKKYAYEELIAEITSTFMSEYIETPITEDNMKQHKAYIQSWISAIRNNKNYLFKAISKAEEASDYMIEKAELDKILENDIEKDDSEKVENVETREYTNELKEDKMTNENKMSFRKFLMEHENNSVEVLSQGGIMKFFPEDIKNILSGSETEVTAHIGNSSSYFNRKVDSDILNAEAKPHNYDEQTDTYYLIIDEHQPVETREYIKVTFHEQGDKFVTKDLSNQIITKEILDNLIKEDEDLYVYNEIVGKDCYGELTNEYQNYCKVYISHIFDGKEIGEDRIDIGNGVFCNHNTWAKLYDKIGEKMPTMEYQIPKIYKDTCKAEIENFFNETDKTWISRAEFSMYAIPTTLMQFSTDELKAMRDYIDDKIFTEPKFDVVINIDEKTKEKIFDRLGFSSQREISKQKDLDIEL